jgi:hypothetical protein
MLPLPYSRTAWAACSDFEGGGRLLVNKLIGTVGPDLGIDVCVAVLPRRTGPAG